MSKSNLSHINELVSRIAREWCDIEEALKPYLDGQDLLSWISQQEKINPNNEINTDRILRTIAGMQCAVIYSSTKGFFDGVELTKISSLEEEFLQYINTNCKNVLNELSKGILNDKSLKIIEDSAKKIAANYK